MSGGHGEDAFAHPTIRGPRRSLMRISTCEYRLFWHLPSASPDFAPLRRNQRELSIIPGASRAGAAGGIVPFPHLRNARSRRRASAPATQTRALCYRRIQPGATGKIVAAANSLETARCRGSLGRARLARQDGPTVLVLFSHFVVSFELYRASLVSSPEAAWDHARHPCQAGNRICT
jgi:hypothetical protein